MKIFLFLFIFILVYNYEVITDITKLIEQINENKVNSNESKKIIESTKNIFEEYPFTNILKNPPNINGKKYFDSVDLLSNLDSLQKEIEESSSMKYYDFYQKYYKIIKQTNDKHIVMEYEKNDILKNILVFSPVVIKTINDEKNLYLKINPGIELYNFTKYVQNYETIKNNEDKPIKKINDKHPFEFIRNFCKDYFTFKNINAKFTYTKRKLFGFYNLYDCPMNKDEFNLIIEYNNNEKIETKFIVVNDNNNQNNNDKNFEYFFWNFKNEEKENIKKGNITNPNLLKKLQESKSDNKTIFRNLDENIEWDIVIENKFKCRVDVNNKVNVYVQNSFEFEFNSIYKNLITCQNKFLSNDYPIIVIENFNNGGSVQSSILFSEIVQNLYNNQLKCSIKIGDYTEEISNEKGFYQDFLKENGDEFVDNEEFLKDITTDKLSDDNEYNRTKQKPFQIKIIQDNKDLIIRNKYKKPTEIIIFTDGYSFSATSFFIKSLHHFGGAIIVGFNGDPDIKKEDFDASQSPTFVLEFENIPNIQIQNDLIDFGYFFKQISYGPSYKNQYIEGKLDYPEEFNVTPVDERVNIYDEYDDTLYQKFIDKAKEIFKKYNVEGKCNPDNKNLKMLNTECDKNFDKYTKGGYECGKDGKWSDKCKPFYCHKNYYFDYVNQKCVKDVIAEKYSIYFSESKTTEEKKIEELENNIKKLENELKKEKNDDGPYKTLFIIFLIIFIILFISDILLLKKN